MARYTGPKNKLSRRAGIDLFSKGLKLRRLNIPPGVHGQKSGHKKTSEYANQLKAKQTVRKFYGVLEKQFRKYYKLASRKKGPTGSNLLQLLEQRLDNVLTRGNITPTRNMARQMIVHGHILVNNQKVTRPSFQVSIKDVITLNPKIQKNPTLNKLSENDENEPAKWLNKKAFVLKVNSLPERDDIPEEFNEQAIIEYYSR